MTKWNVVLLHKDAVLGHKIASSHDEAVRMAEKMLKKHQVRMDITTFIAPA